MNPFNFSADYPSLLFITQMVEIAYRCPHFKFTLNEMLDKLNGKGIVASMERVQRELKKSDKFAPGKVRLLLKNLYLEKCIQAFQHLR